MSRRKLRRVEFQIPGRPAPKGSRAVGFRKDGSVYTREQNKRVGPWMRAAEEALSGNLELEPPYRVHIAFVFERPKNPKYDFPPQADLDKLCRALLDAAQKSNPPLIVDDKFVLHLEAEKFYGPKELTRGWVEEI